MTRTKVTGIIAAVAALLAVSACGKDADKQPAADVPELTPVAAGAPGMVDRGDLAEQIATAVKAAMADVSALITKVGDQIGGRIDKAEERLGKVEERIKTLEDKPAPAYKLDTRGLADEIAKAMGRTPAPPATSPPPVSRAPEPASPPPAAGTAGSGAADDDVPLPRSRARAVEPSVRDDEPADDRSTGVGGGDPRDNLARDDGQRRDMASGYGSRRGGYRSFDDVAAGSHRVRSHGRNYNLGRVTPGNAACVPPRKKHKTNDCWKEADGGISCRFACY